MVETEVHNRIMTASEAVKKSVDNGNELSIGNFLYSSPSALLLAMELLIKALVKFMTGKKHVNS